MVKTVKQIWMGIILALILLFTGIVHQVNALPLPALDFQGSVYIDLDYPYANPNPLNTIEVTSYTDKDGWDSSLISPNDPILGQPVSGFDFVGINYDWVNDALTINPNATAKFLIGTMGDPYLTADASKISVVKKGYRQYNIDVVLINHTFFHTNDSHFMNQFADAVGTPGTSQILTWDVVFDLTNVPADYDYKVNVSGKLAPVPEPATIMLMGAGLIGIGGAARKKVFKKS